MIRRSAIVSVLILGALLLVARDRVAASWPEFDLTRYQNSIADIAGSVMPRDVDTGTPSLNSDRLVIGLGGVKPTPVGYSLQAYLLDGENGFFCGNLTVSGGNVNAVLDFPGNNLIGHYNSFRMMWERTLFENTLPAEALDLIRKVVVRGEGTPSGIAYGVGLVQQAQLMLTHANLARSAASAGSLSNTKVHAEHVLNILYGKDDPRYGDHDGNGKIENPGDGFGVLAYAANVDYEMLLAAESVGVTDHISERAFAVTQVIANFAPADGDGNWSDELIAQAEAALAAATAGDALPLTTAMRTQATRILNGVDADQNGEVEAIAGEGGARTAFATAQQAADYLPPGPISGVVEHGAAANNPTSDRITIALENVPAPPEGYSLWGYLVADDGKRLVLGELPWDAGTVEASFSYSGRNLIGEFNSFRLAQGTIYAEDTLPLAPLTSLRKILATADDTPAGAGYGVGLMQQARLLRETAAQASAAASGGNLATAKLRTAETLNILVGKGDPRYDKGVADPGDGFGVLGYAGGMDLALSQAASDPGATENMIANAGGGRAALANLWPATGTGTWADELLVQLGAVAAAGTAQEAVAPASAAAALADRILNGAGQEGGARTAYVASQQAADYFPQEAGASQPKPDPEPGPNPDTFENDDLCSRAETIATDGSLQRHTFHYNGDQDWVRFTAQANKSYVIDVTGVGNNADPVIFLYDTCASAPSSFEGNAFGNTVRLIWNATRNGIYYIQLRQFDPAVFGAGTEYDLAVTLDASPPSPPTNLRCLSIDQTTLGIQWKRSPEFDVAGYQVFYSNEDATDTGIRDIEGASTTFIELEGLTPNELYYLEVQALDYSRNASESSGVLQCRPVQPTDQTVPTIGSLLPSFSSLYTTTAPALTFSGAVQDSGNNLSRVVVRNASTNQEKSDFTLSGGAAEFRVEDLSLRVGVNDVRVTVFDEANNSTTHQIEVRRLADNGGAVLIVAGHNETFGLQTNIYNAANRAYRIFLSAGFAPEDIRYLAPVAQDATGDGVPDTLDATLSPAAVQEAITVWAKERVGPDKPFFLYLMDHGFADRYCVTGCTEGNIITPKELNEWLVEMEDASNVEEVSIFIEACQSGSFLDNLEGEVTNPLNSLAREGRVVITSTGRANNAYASADGAFFSDAFFSCLADSGNMKACFDEATAAVALTGVDQTPWLDDNADGIFNSGDGAAASQRSITRFFSSVRPVITDISVAFDGQSGLLTANVEEGAEAVRLVWAAVLPPNFPEPDGVTLNLNMPVVRLEPVADTPGRYEFNYVNGFTEPGDYTIVFYAQDRFGINATPVRLGDESERIYLPLLSKDQ